MEMFLRTYVRRPAIKILFVGGWKLLVVSFANNKYFCSNHNLCVKSTVHFECRASVSNGFELF